MTTITDPKDIDLSTESFREFVRSRKLKYKLKKEKELKRELDYQLKLSNDRDIIFNEFDAKLSNVELKLSILEKELSLIKKQNNQMTDIVDNLIAKCSV